MIIAKLRKPVTLSIATSCVACVLFLSLAFLPLHISAAIVWEDNFDDPVLDGWTGDMVNYTGDNGYLESLTNTSGALLDYNLALHENTVETGTWSLDVLITSFDNGWFQFHFWRTSNALTRMSVIITYAYLEIERGDDRMANYNAPWPFGWNHIDLTIDESWNIEVFLNGDHIIHYHTIDPSIENEVFRLAVCNEGDGIDNISVSDTVDVVCTDPECELWHPELTITTPTVTTPTTTAITTSTTTSTTEPPLDLTLPIIGVAAVAVVVIVLILARKR